MAGTHEYDSTLGAMFLGNLAAAMYVAARISGSYAVPISRQFLWHYVRTNIHILQEEV